MDYEKAFGRAKSAYGTGAYDDATLEFIFPQLAESEDERIRRTLVEYFGPEVQLDFVRGVPIRKIRDWLEKQKEQKPVQSNAEKEYVRTLKSLISDFLRGKEDVDRKYYQQIFDWLDGRHIEQKPAEWSEEDENKRQRIIKVIEAADSDWVLQKAYGPYGDLINWLKSLRPQPHWKPTEEQQWEEPLTKLEKAVFNMLVERTNEITISEKQARKYAPIFLEIVKGKHWKPSEEQMKALLGAEGISRASGYPDNAKVLASLYEQLKKL